MSALQFKSFSTDSATQRRHFGGYAIIIRQIKHILRQFEIFNFFEKNAFFGQLHCGLRARKNRDFEAS